MGIRAVRKLEDSSEVVQAKIGVKSPPLGTCMPSKIDELNTADVAKTALVKIVLGAL